MLKVAADLLRFLGTSPFFSFAVVTSDFMDIYISCAVVVI
jgi:hypothetical protein